METIHLTKAEFLKKVCNYEANPNEWKYEGTVPCIIDFYATWCGPCKMISPVLAELAKEYNGKIVVYKVDVDEEQDLASAFGVQSIPTLLWIPMKGKPTVTRGAMMKSDLKKMIDQTLLK
jgi:thioredoxin